MGGVEEKFIDSLFADDACPVCGGVEGHCVCQKIEHDRCPKCKKKGMRVGILLWCDDCKDHYEVM
jgi:hypothetical protein